MPMAATATDPMAMANSKPWEKWGASGRMAWRKTGASQCSKVLAPSQAGRPIQPPATDSTASATRGRVITAGDSCRWCLASGVIRSVEKNVSTISRVM